MSELEKETQDPAGDSLIRALARTPAVLPFEGTERYRVRACLGEGGFGVVYEVEDCELGRRLALKTLKQQRVGYAANIRRLKREFRSVADLVHPNLACLHELASDGTHWFFTMELVRGSDFLEYVCGKSSLAYAHTAVDSREAPASRRITSGILSEPRLRMSLRQLVEGVSALHAAGIVHRDLKPSNVLVEAEGRVVILDFGLAGSEEPADRELSIDLAGTPAYMAPEQAASKTVTTAADWYAVGVMLYEALTGRLPFDDATGLAVLQAKWAREAELPSRFARVPEDLERLCLALLQRDPKARPDGAAILELLGTAPADSKDSKKSDETSVFMGRARELDVLRAALADVRRGEARVVRVHGQPGIGKSTLLARFLDEARERGGAAVLAGSCYERESVPFKAFDGIADALVRYLRALPRNEASALMPRDIHLVTQLFPVLESVPAVRDVPRRSLLRLDPTEARLRAIGAIKELVSRIADKQPLVIAIDDLQWGDLDSARILTQLVTLPERPIVLLVLSHRAEEAERSTTLGETLGLLETAGARTIDVALEALPEAEAERLAAHVLGKSGASSAAARDIALRSEGHPLFIAELARAASLAGGSTPPPTLIDILWQRVMRLSDSARALLETVAVAGQPLLPSLCFEAAGLGPSGVDALRLLRAEQLVRSAESGLINVFHDRVRDAVLMRSDTATRRMRHLALAVSLERSSGRDFEALARHFDAAEDHERAARYAVRAGDAAVQALAFDRAAALYRMAIDRAGTGRGSAELFTKLGDALLHGGSNAPAGRAYLEAARLSEGRTAIDLTRRGAEQLLMVGEVDAGLEAAARALGSIGATVPKSIGRSMLEAIYHHALLRLGGFRLRERDRTAIDPDLLFRLNVLQSSAIGIGYVSVPLCFGLMMRFARAALKSGDPCLGAQGLVYCCFGFTGPERSRTPLIDELLDRVDAIGERLADRSLLALSRRMRAETHYIFGNLRESLRLCDETDALIAESSEALGVHQRAVRVLAAYFSFKLGDLERATALANALLLDAVERDDAVAERSACVQVLAPLCLAADDPIRAQQFVERVGMEDRCAILLYRREAAADVAMYEGRSHDAVASWRESWERLKEEGLLTPAEFRLAVARSFGAALAASPESDRNLRELRRLARSIQRYRFPRATAIHRTLLAYLALHAGSPERAAAFLVKAAEDYDSIGCVLDAAACRYREAQIASDSESGARIRAAEDTLRSHGIACPERWAGMMVPPVATRQLTA